jgi:hydroxymethylpyrimidine pyrophosphatase-like HAD family hydrolase
MKLSALALDYDGTIAIDGALDPAVREAIADVRRRGIVVVLATGRQLTELRRVAGDLACFDAIVAENGAVLDFPASGRHTMLAHAPHPAFLNELRRLQVAFTAGECVVEADASAAATMLQVVRSLELALTLTFNRGRLMVLPQAVAKSTGLRQALRALRVSIHNTVAIGDAENDHDLLDACEVGAAVEWGSPALKSVADETILGAGPAAVGDYIHRLLEQPRLSAAQMGRRRLHLGYEHTGAEVSLAVRGRTILVAGEPGTGKSWLAGLLCEQLILQGYCVCVVDPEGDYPSLAALPDVMMLGGDDPPPTARELARALEHPDVSVVIDLSKLVHRDKVGYVRTLMPLLVAMRRRTGLPHKILLDEAHYFLGDVDHTCMIDPELAGYIVVTYRISALDPALRQTGDAVTLVTRETNIDEVTALLGMCRPQPPPTASTSLFRDLQTNEAALLPGALESHGSIRRFQLAPRLTEHVRHRTKYVDMPVANAHAFVFAEGGHSGPRARTLKRFIDLLLELPSERLAGHLHRHDVSRWIGDVFRDRPLALRIRTLESRILSDDARDVAGTIAQTIRARYETTATRPDD